jgi:putative transposase
MTKHQLPLGKRCELLSIPRSSAYYQSTDDTSRDDVLMRAMDEIHLRLPFYGSRRIGDELAEEGQIVNRKRVQRLMRRMGMNTLYPKPNTSRAHHAHKVYPYLLRGLNIGHANQVWCADITYIPMRKGFLYLVAIMDWHSRKVLSWRTSNTLDTGFCVAALHEALCTYGRPEIFNTDQGSQFTSEDFTQVLKDAGVRISMDGKGRWRDNVFIERLWRSLKYEEVYLTAYDTIPQAREGISRWMHFYNQRRKHQALEKRTPDMMYYESKNLEAPMGASA